MTAAWEALAGTALLGTSRKPLDAAVLPDVVIEQLRRSASADSATQLLDAAALFVLYERAGATAVPVPAHADDPDDRVAPPASGRPLPAAALTRLADLLRGVGTNTAGMLGIWLAAAADAGFDAPPECLPELLDLAITRPELASDIRRVLGTRGHWLAAQRSDWRAWLHIDEAEPVVAAKLLAAEWAALGGPGRLAHIGALETNLSAGDEALLEQARADPRKDVRLAAQRLLARVPGSAYLRKLTELATGALTITREQSQEHLQITLSGPSTDSAATGVEFAVPKWLRDLPLPDHHSRAPVALLWYLASVVPLGTWETALGRSPADLVKLPMAGNLAYVMHNGWDDAAIRERNAGWAMALMGWRDPSSMGALLLALPPARRQNVVIAALTRDHAGPQAISAGTAASILANCPPPWTPEFTSALLDWLARESQASNIWGAFGVLARLGQWLPPGPSTEAAVRAIARTHPVNSSWYPALAELAATLLYRRQMLEELR